MNVDMTVDMGVKCPECGKGGAITKAGDKPGCGLCMACVSKAMYGVKALKSPAAMKLRLLMINAANALKTK